MKQFDFSGLTRAPTEAGLWRIVDADVDQAGNARLVDGPSSRGSLETADCNPLLVGELLMQL